MTIDLSLPWHTLPHAVLDFESTGIDADRKAVEVAAVRFEGGCPVARFSTLLHPGIPIPEAATKVHGINDAMVANAPRLSDVAGDLLRICRGSFPVAYSAHFDREMLHAEITGKDCMAFDTDHSWADLLVIIRDVDRWERGPGRHKLVNACKRYGVIIEGAHRAEADALGTGALLWALKDRLGDISAADLIRRCDVRRMVQDAEFAAWKARQPKREAVE